MLRTVLRRALAAAIVLTAAFGLEAQSNVTSPRLYVFDGGVLASETARYRLTDADVQEVELSVASFLIVHPRGVLMWDAGDVTHLALSHYHWDHTADANLFANAQWLVPKLEHDAMFSTDPPGGTRPETYSALKSARTTLITTPEYDVF